MVTFHKKVEVEPGYSPLVDVLVEALEQSQHGKGKDRHANDRSFMYQPIIEIGRMVGPGFNIGQAIKKGQEVMGNGIPDTEDKVRELLGGIVYLASAVTLLRERECNASSQA